MLLIVKWTHIKHYRQQLPLFSHLPFKCIYPVLNYISHLDDERWCRSRVWLSYLNDRLGPTWWFDWRGECDDRKCWRFIENDIIPHPIYLPPGWCRILETRLPRMKKTKCVFGFFLHDRPWISPWIKTISNEIDIICHVFASQLSGHCDVIANRLWRHQQKASETLRWNVKILVFSVNHGFVMSCKKYKWCMNSCDELFMRSLECYFGVYFPRCCATREINIKITLSWAHKQFATRVHTLFYM